MLFELLGKINWVDIFAVILFIRICFIATKYGFAVELFKLSGVLASLFASLHYYTAISDFVRGRVQNQKAPLEFLDFLSFIILAILAYLLFVLMRSVLYRYLKLEAVSYLNKWGALLLGIFRSFLTLGLIMYMLVISSTSYLKSSVSDSFTGKRLFKIAPDTYAVIWNVFASKFLTAEKFNNTVLEVQGDFLKK
jgi:uncharacterized membrane protein required for colicin V production